MHGIDIFSMSPVSHEGKQIHVVLFFSIKTLKSFATVLLKIVPSGTMTFRLIFLRLQLPWEWFMFKWEHQACSDLVNQLEKPVL